jgi:hypothetical protein
MENPVQKLGATGAGEVQLFLGLLISPFYKKSPVLCKTLIEMLEQEKAHPFFKDINWDMLARQKVTTTLNHFR